MDAKLSICLLSALLLSVTQLVTACGSPGKHAPGLVAGRLTPCPDSPNCISSEETRAAARVAPLVFSGDPEDAWDDLKRALTDQGGSLVKEETGYLAATFTSALFRFVDDVEFRLDAEAGIIQVRSASRLGYSDFGVNRKRVEALRASFTTLQRAAPLPGSARR